MRQLLCCVGLLVSSASAQVVPDDFPEPTTSIADRVERQWAERALPFLSNLYSQSEVALGPSVGGLAPVVATTVEGGYRLRGGDAVSVMLSLKSEVGEDALTGGLTFNPGAVLTGVQYTLGLGRLAPASPLAQRAEVGIGVTSAVIQGHVGGAAIELAPRYVLPTGRYTSVPVGVRISYALDRQGTAPYASPLFVGASAAMRLGYVSPRRIVLE